LLEQQPLDLLVTSTLRESAVLADAPANPLAVLKDATLAQKAAKTFPHLITIW
jgi:hypothetical protein